MSKNYRKGLAAQKCIPIDYSRVVIVADNRGEFAKVLTKSLQTKISLTEICYNTTRLYSDCPQSTGTMSE